jgi:hypothetical protein
MLLSLLAASAMAFQSISWNPLTFTLVDLGGSGDTVAIAFYDPYGNVCPMTDAAGVQWGSVTVTLSSNQKVGISNLLLSTKPDGTNLLVTLPKNATVCRANVLTGATGVATVGWSTGGTVDGSAGAAGSGCNLLPSSSVPDRWYVGDGGQVFK